MKLGASADIEKMSSGVAGKFQDHYLLLGLDPKADSETIQAAYAKAAEKYHPHNPETGDDEKFEAVNLAYEVLSDPVLRASFDKLKGVDHESGRPKFSGADFFPALEQASALRSAILCLLYDRRRLNPSKPSLSMRHLDGMLQVTPDELNFALWYLKQRGLVINDDKSSVQITVEGMDQLEKRRPAAEAVMALVKPEAITEASTSPQAPAVESKVPEPVLNVLNRALSRSYEDGLSVKKR
jgi:DnaJ domain